MHKTAGDLKVGETFLMAGDLYKIIDIYETVDDEVMKMVISPVNSHRRFTLAIDRDAFFKTA